MERRRGIKGLWSFARAHPVALRAIVGAGIVALVGGFLWFRPDKLFVEKSVDEAAPPSLATSTPTASGSPAAETRVISSAMFVSLEHRTTGTAKIIRTADGRHILRFENLDTSNGPDLVVYLSPAEPDQNDWKKYAAGAVDLGPLKGNRGNQNYTIPVGVDLSKYRSAVVWCRRFVVGFGAATIRLS